MALNSRLATGIHITDNIVHIVVLEKIQQQIVLKGLIQASLPNSLNGQRADTSAQLQIAEAIADIACSQELRLRNAYVSLDNREVLLKRRPLGSDEENCQYEQLQWEAGYFLPSDPDEYGMDFLLTPFGGFVIAVQRCVLELYVNNYHQVGIKDIGIDIVPFALYNVLEQIDNIGKDRVDLLLDIRPTELQLMVLDGGHVRVVDSWRYDRETADVQKLNELVEKVQKVFITERDMDVPQQLWLAGEVETKDFWRIELAQRLAIVVNILDPFLDLDTAELEADQGGSLLDQRAVFAVAAGLAYRSLSE